MQHILLKRKFIFRYQLFFLEDELAVYKRSEGAAYCNHFCLATVAAMSLRVLEIFPKEPSNKPLTRPTEYPEKKFAYWTPSTGKHTFIYYMNKENQVCYLKKNPSHKTDIAAYRISKSCRGIRYSTMDLSEINFHLIKQRLRKDPTEEGEDDTRIGFKIGNHYLVKRHFTSGIRTVERGTAHVVQTLGVPVLLYLKPTTTTTSNRYFQSDDEKSFPYERLHTYELSILPKHTANRIPPGTRYVLLTVRQSYFTFDVVPENYQIPFKYRDPVRHKITKLPGWSYNYSKPLDLSSSSSSSSNTDEPPSDAAAEIITLE